MSSDGLPTRKMCLAERKAATTIKKRLYRNIWIIDAYFNNIIGVLLLILPILGNRMPRKRTEYG